MPTRPSLELTAKEWPRASNARWRAAPAENIGTPAAARHLAFDALGHSLAVSSSDGRVGIYDAGSRALKREVQTGLGRNGFLPVAFDAAAELLATIGPGDTVQLHPLPGGKGPI